MTASAKSKVPPGPQGNFFVGSLYDFKSNPLQLLLQLWREHGDICRFRIGLTELYMVSHPDLITHVLVDKDRRYRKSRLDIQALGPFVGQGLLTSEGDLWKRQRRLLQPLFSHQLFETYSKLVADYTGEMLDRWGPLAASGETFDLGEHLTALTMRVISKAILGLDVSGVSQEVVEALEFGMDYAATMQETIVPLPEWVPTPGHLKFQRAKKVLDDMVNGLSAPRRASGAAGNDLLTLMMRAKDEETGEALSDDLLRDQVLTFFAAGHETTAQSLKWVFAMLSKHPNVDRTAHEEARRVLGGRAPTYKEAGELEYTKMVVQEVMRLWPPVWIMEREAVAEDELAGYPIAPGTQVAFSQWVMHRHPAYWENPEGFDPERFRPERSAGRPHGAYFPFGAGPRVCIGNTFSLMEMQMIIPTVLQRYRLDLMPSPPLVPKPTLTLRPMYGVPVRAVPRKG
jgi:cytochrome P450